MTLLLALALGPGLLLQPQPETSGARASEAALPRITALLAQPAPRLPAELVTALQDGLPVVVAFLGADSGASVEQAVELDALAERASDLVRIVRVDIATPAGRAAASAWLVHSTPALGLVAPRGRVAGVWEGVATASELIGQLDAARDVGAPPRASGDDDGESPGGDGANPREGTSPVDPELTARATSAVNEDYGAARLVDGLLPGDEGFRPWVSSCVGETPMVVDLSFATPRLLRGIEVLARTGPPAIFAPRWPREIKVSIVRAGAIQPEALITLTVGPEGDPVRIDLAEENVSAVVLTILSLQGEGSICELAETRVW